MLQSHAKRKMGSRAGKPSILRNILMRLLLFSIIGIVVRFTYVITVGGESCSFGSLCFSNMPENLNLVISGAGLSAIAATNDAVDAEPLKSAKLSNKKWIKAVKLYSSVFEDLIAEGILSPASKSLCIGTVDGKEVLALKEMGIKDSTGVYSKQLKPRLWFSDSTFDFVFSGEDYFNKLSKPLDVAAEIVRTLKPDGFAVFHVRIKDEYSYNSFLELFTSCNFMRSRELKGLDSEEAYLREIVLQKQGVNSDILRLPKSDGNSKNKCSIPRYKNQIVHKAEPLIMEEPLKPWITLKSNLRNIKYLTTMVDVSFKNRYVYIDVGARSYGSSIGSWFRKHYQMQNKSFEIYAIEADRSFHDEYKSKKGVTLLPYAAWVRDELLTFEINHDPRKQLKDRIKGMGRIQPANAQTTSFEYFDGEVDTIKGFDFAEWVKNNVEERDLVVMKMDVEGTEFELIPRLIETGAICLIDEVFLECHYNRWQRCCPGQRSSKYEKTYKQCLELFTSLREKGVLVHQWW